MTAELERRRQRGITDLPDPIPHPEDIVIDLHTGHVRTDGPLDEREKRDWNERLARRDEAQCAVNRSAQMCRTSRSEKRKAVWQAEWHFEQRIFDIINDSMPKRYKMTLENRSYALGASREGEALDELRGNRTLRNEYLK